MQRRRMGPALLAMGLLAAAVPASAQLAQGDVTATSRPLRLLRSWEETVKGTGGREFARRVDVVFDYEKGVAYENFYTLDGIQTGRMTLGAGHPAPSQVEIQEAYDIVRADPEFELIFKRFHVVFEGGFVLLEEKGRPCGPGSRCLRVFLLSSDRAGTIRPLVVDLVKERVAYDDYVPETRRSGK
ncbi:MAG TPA: hypothetical protein VN032_00440 [Thermoanaerobaculia bacterium]|jgi:hypothetical protein|nr:hypothetical protein [Thermoanaerobaculia bacterium]